MDTIKRSELIRLTKVIYGDSSIEKQQLVLLKIAVAKAARISYTIVGQEKEHDYTKDIALYDSLLKSGHMSPFEHVARAMSEDELDNYILIEGGVTIPGVCRNFTGFIQHRALIEKVFK